MRGINFVCHVTTGRLDRTLNLIEKCAIALALQLMVLPATTHTSLQNKKDIFELYQNFDVNVYKKCHF